MSEPRESLPPAALVPIPPARVEQYSVQGYTVRATWSEGLERGTIGHLYVVDVTAAAVANDTVWQALAEATLAGLCARCTPYRDAEQLIRVHVAPAVVEVADELIWAHAPVLGITCPSCERGQ